MEAEKNNKGEETLTWAKEGSIIGTLMGVILGGSVYLLFSFNFLNIEGLDRLRLQGPYALFFLIFAVITLFGAAAARLVELF